MIELLRKLSLASGISGDEGEIREIIREEAEKYADRMEVDALGNLLAFKKGKSSAKTVLVAAHMDEIGFIVNGIGEDGFIHFGTVGGIDSRTVYGKRVLVGPKKVQGVIGAKPVHQRSKGEKGKAYSMDELYADIGAKDKAEACEMVSLGDTAVYDSEFLLFGKGRIKGKALDNRAGCAAALEAMKDIPFYDTWFAFTVQEEVGLKGAAVAAYAKNPDFAIVVDTTTAADFSGVDPLRNASSLGKGTVIFQMESTTYYRPEAVQFAVDTANFAGILYQHKNVVAGGLDAGAIQPARCGIETISIATPCRYLHSPACVIDKADFTATAALLSELLQALERKA